MKRDINFGDEQSIKTFLINRKEKKVTIAELISGAGLSQDIRKKQIEDVVRYNHSDIELIS